MIKRHMAYREPGVLKGHTPKGQLLTVRHPKPGQSKFIVIWDGQTYEWLSAGRVEDEFGINVYRKKTGSQAGYPSEAVTRAVWRYLVDRYNEGDPDVTKI